MSSQVDFAFLPRDGGLMIRDLEPDMGRTVLLFGLLDPATQCPLVVDPTVQLAFSVRSLLIAGRTLADIPRYARRVLRQTVVQRTTRFAPGLAPAAESWFAT